MAVNFGGYYSMNIYSSEIYSIRVTEKGSVTSIPFGIVLKSWCKHCQTTFSANVIILLPIERLFGAETRSSEQLSCRYKSSHALQTETW